MIQIKTTKDIELLKVGGARHATILRELGKMVKPGVSTMDLENRARELIATLGDEAAFLNYTPDGAPRPYPAALCVSINDEIVHGIPNEEPVTLKTGDVVSLDLGLTHKELITDAAVTVGVGKISPEAEKLIKVCREALSKGIKAAVVGNRINNISEAIEKHVLKNGFKLAEHLAGHGVGYAVHEEPYVPNVVFGGKSELLKPGMVLAIEPMFTTGSGEIVLSPDGYTYKTKDGALSAHFEHTVAITGGEPLILTA